MSLDDRTDEALMDEWRRGDTSAGDLLCRRFQPSLRRWLLSQVPAGDVDDVLQRMWTTIADKIRREDADGALDRSSTRNLRASLYAFAKNTVFHYYRELYREQKRQEEFDPDVHTPDILGPSLSSVLAREQLAENLRIALQSMPISQRMLVTLRYVEELGSPALAQIFGVPAATIRTRLMTVRRQLGERMAQLERGGT